MSYRCGSQLLIYGRAHICVVDHIMVNPDLHAADGVCWTPEGEAWRGPDSIGSGRVVTAPDYTSAPEPAPRPSTEADGPTMHELAAEAIRARADFGLAKYGTPLRPFDGRNHNTDVIDELIDGLVYAFAARQERAAMLARIAALETALGCAVVLAERRTHAYAEQVGEWRTLLRDRLPGDE